MNSSLARRSVTAWMRRAENPHGTYLPSDDRYYRRGGTDEAADCAVRAVAMVSGRDYETVYPLFERAGRKARRRTAMHVTHRVLDYLKCGHETVETPKTTVQAFALTHPTGRWLVQVSGHLLAVVDGTIHDWSGQSGRRAVKGLWRVS